MQSISADCSRSFAHLYPTPRFQTSTPTSLPREVSWRTLLLIVVTLLLTLPTFALGQPLTPAALELRILEPPVALPALGRRHLVYEVVLTNFGSEPRVMESLSVLEGSSDKVLADWSGDELERRLSIVGSPASAPQAPATLAPGGSTVAFLWLTLSPEEIPAAFRHRLTTTDATGGDKDFLTTEAVSVLQAKPLALESPVASGPWVALRGPSNTSGHRRSVVTLDGATRVPQRYAVDWARLGEDGLLFRNRGKRNEDWYGYGQPVMAAQGGTVARVIEGIPDHAPLSREAAEFIDRGRITGNTVIVDLGDGQYAVYAHLRPGTIAVKEGQTIETGDILGEIGNSGHSLAPHLHFHLADRVDPLASDGLPFAMRSFVLEGRLDSLQSAVSGTAWRPHPSRPSREVSGETPLENMVLRFDANP